MSSKDSTVIEIPDRSNSLATYPRDRTVGYHPRIIAANRKSHREADCVFGWEHRSDLSFCSRCSLDILRCCIYSAYRPLNISAGQAHDGHGHPLLDYLDNERYLLDPDTMVRLLHPVTYRPIKVIDLRQSFAMIRTFYRYQDEEQDFQPVPPSTIIEVT